MGQRLAVVIVDSTGRPARRLSVSLQWVQRSVWTAGCLGLVLLGCGLHGVWARRHAYAAQRLAHINNHLRQLVDTLTREVPATRDAAALAELNFVQLWAKSGLGLEPDLLDVPPGDATPVSQAESAPRDSADDTPAVAAAPPAVSIDALEVGSLPDAARHLTAEGRALSGTLGDTLEYFHDAERMLLNTPSIRPARTAWYSSSYGIRLHPISHVLLMHKGLDMGGFAGMEIFAPADGVVIWTGSRGGYGLVVVIDHGFGLQTHFAHLSRYGVKRGQRVRRGERIAEMGTTGHSTGPHLHYEVRRFGQPMDPRRFILD